MSADILITESFSPRNAQGWSGTTRLATSGLPALLDGWLSHCADTKPGDVPHVDGGK
jgi:hypothetical protein